jgi:DNA-binding NarL/FixJ family response regulator
MKDTTIGVWRSNRQKIILTPQMEEKKTTRVAIVEDNRGIRESWAKLINAQKGLACVGAWPSGESALAGLPASQPDVVLMDINLPGMSGIECTARLKQKVPNAQILIVTIYSDNEHLFEALKAGASGYLLKSAEREELARAITELTAGGAPMSGSIARRVIETFRAQDPLPNAAARLSPREQEILGWLSRGLVTKDVAMRLDMNYETVRVHLRHIYDKLHVHSRGEAVAKYLSTSEGLNAQEQNVEYPQNR